MPRHTLVHQLADWADRTPTSPAMHHKVGDRWHTRTWAEYWRDVRDAAKGLIALGHSSGDAVAIVGENRMEWVVLELAIMAARGLPAPIYTTNTAEQVAYIIDNAQARIAICDGDRQRSKLIDATAHSATPIERIVTMVELEVDDDRTTGFEALLALGRAERDDELDARISAIASDDTALLIYTSGTTGQPKGVMLEHGAMVLVAEAIQRRTPAFGTGEFEYRTVSYLPLCHAAEQLLTTLGHLATGGQVFFCPDIQQIKDYLVEVRPTVFLGVPRVWEKFEAALGARLAEQRGIKGWLTRWARATELAAFHEEVRTGTPVRSVQRALARRLVIDKVQAALGLDRLYYPVTGSAPISTGTLEFFASLGIVVYEAYGMSETTGVCTVGTPGSPRIGRVGSPLDCVDVRIADDGEIQLRGPTMTKGYLRLPDETRELFTDDGWLRTGDVGDLDAEGHLAITGRIKDILITAGGKNVAPAELEAYMQQIVGVAQAVVVGDRKPYLAALITLDPERMAELGRQFGCAPTVEALATSEALHEWLRVRIEAECNAKVARYQTIKRFAVLPVEFSVERDELTPTMKLRRNVIVRRYAAEIDRLYDDAAA